MEDTLRDVLRLIAAIPMLGLNPCFNGRYSQRFPCGIVSDVSDVLILVLMEDTLRDFRPVIYADGSDGLNPCFNGRYSQSKSVKNLKVKNVKS